MAMIGSRLDSEQDSSGHLSAQRFHFGQEYSMQAPTDQPTAQQLFSNPDFLNLTSTNSYTTPNPQNNDLFGLRSLFGNSIENRRESPDATGLRRAQGDNANFPHPNILKNMENYGLSSRNRSLKFQIPVMLNPGELLSITPRQNHLFGDGNVHLHLNAQVHLPRKSIP